MEVVSGELYKQNTKDSATILLPWPPSVNHYWRSITQKGRAMVLISEAGRKYRADVKRRAWEFGLKTMFGPLSIDIVARQPDRRRRDLDNLLKATLDSLTHSGIIEDDSQFHKITLQWGRRFDGGMLELTLRTMTTEEASG